VKPRSHSVAWLVEPTEKGAFILSPNLSLIGPNLKQKNHQVTYNAEQTSHFATINYDLKLKDLSNAYYISVIMVFNINMTIETHRYAPA
jgi:cytochrome c biogenesis protein ResB